MDKIEVDLKGADFQKRLVWRTNEGFNVQPFYRREDLKDLKTPDSLPGEFPFVRGNKKDSNAWYVRQNIVVDDVKAANAKALDILNKGIDSLGFKLPGKMGYDKEKVVGSIEWDPMQKMVMKGKDVSSLLPLASSLVDVLKDYPNFRCIAVSTDALNNAGAYIVQELGYALAWGNEYLQQLVDAGVDVDLAAKSIKFNMGVSENYFMEIAKFRAARLLWAQIVKQYAPKCDCACKMVINATTSTSTAMSICSVLRPRL